MKKCGACGIWRSKVYTCAVCAKKLCGCCSHKSSKNGKRVCCTSDLACVRANVEQHAKLHPASD